MFHNIGLDDSNRPSNNGSTIGWLKSGRNQPQSTPLSFIEEIRKRTNSVPQGSLVFSENSIVDTDNPSGNPSKKVPKPPGVPKSSALIDQQSAIPAVPQTHEVTFKPYRSTRPALLDELNNLLNTRLQKDAFTEEARIHNFQVYRDAFQRFIDDFNIYKGFLTSVKHEYDAHIEKFAFETRTVTVLRTELATKEQEYGMIVRSVERAQEQKMKDLENERNNMEKSLKDQAKVLKQMQVDNGNLSKTAAKAMKEFEELRATCATLTNSLTRLEGERRLTLASQNAKHNDFINMKSTADKALSEIDRLRHEKHDLETERSQLVPQDEVNDIQCTLDTLKAEVKAKDMNHKELIYRYSLLKQTIDTTWCQHVPEKKQQELYENSKEHENPMSDDQTDDIKKLGHLGAHTTSARVLMETLLTQVIELQKSSNEANTQPVGNNAFNAMGMASNNIDGAIVLKDEEFSTPWSHFVGLGYDENNPCLPPVPVNITSVHAAKTPTSHHHHHHHHHSHPHSVGIAGTSHSHNMTIHSTSVLANSSAFSGMAPLSNANNASFHSDINSLLNNTGIPKFLQYEGRIKHMFLSKWETETCVNEVWAAKEELASKQVKQEQTHGLAHDFDPTIIPDVSFAEFYWDFIEKKFNYDATKAIAFSYNFLDALKKYSWDSDCKIFLMVLEGKLAEHIRMEQITLIENLQAELIREETLINTDLTFTLSVSNFNRIMRKTLSYKTEQSFVRLEKALTLENKGNRVVYYLKLLGEDESGSQGHYCEMLRAQHLQESLDFSEHLERMIDKARVPRDTKEMTITALREAIMRADPNKPRNEVNSYLARGCHMAVEDVLLLEAKKSPISLAIFLRRLKRGTLFPSPVASKMR